MGQLTILGNRWLTEETESCLSLVVFGIQDIYIDITVILH